MHAIIMAGGSGTRFWPASRHTRPKQFLPLAHGKSLIQATVDRVRDLTGPERTWIVTNAQQAKLLVGVLDDFPVDQIIVEPEARDTAPCIGLAAATIEARDPGATMAIMPADHLIEPVDEFQALLHRGGRLAESDETLVTFGIPPTRPATGFGYIELGNALQDVDGAFEVLRFREKPDAATAQTFLAAGQFLWNSGIFVWNYASLTRAMQVTEPDLAGRTEAMLDAVRRSDTAALTVAFSGTPKTSIDYAVMEKADNVVVLRSDFKWSDLGSFAALDVLVDKDPYGNILLDTHGVDAIVHQSENCTVYAEGTQTVTLFGMRDVIVVSTGDAVLVCPRDRADDLKELIQIVRQSGRSDLL